MSSFSDYVRGLAPIAYYRMNAASGFQRDSSGNANHATFQGGTPTYAVAGGLVGEDDTAFQQATTSGETSRSGMIGAPSTAFTVAALVKLSGTPANTTQIVLHGWAGVGAFLMYESSTQVHFGVVDSTGAQRNAGMGATIPRDGAFHRIVGTYDGTTVKVYRDGVKGTDAAIVNPPTLYTGTNFRFPASSASGVTMTVDEVMILGTAWSAAEVALDLAWVNGYGLPNVVEPTSRIAPGLRRPGALRRPHFNPATWALGEIVLPVATVTAGPTPARISAVGGFDSTAWTFEVDEVCQAWELRQVGSGADVRNPGAQPLVLSGSAVPATTGQPKTVTYSDLSAAGIAGSDGAKLLKVFAQDNAGNWST